MLKISEVKLNTRRYHHYSIMSISLGIPYALHSRKGILQALLKELRISCVLSDPR